MTNVLLEEPLKYLPKDICQNILLGYLYPFKNKCDYHKCWKPVTILFDEDKCLCEEHNQGAIIMMLLYNKCSNYAVLSIALGKLYPYFKNLDTSIDVNTYNSTIKQVQQYYDNNLVKYTKKVGKTKISELYIEDDDNTIYYAITVNKSKKYMTCKYYDIILNKPYIIKFLVLGRINYEYIESSNRAFKKRIEELGLSINN